MGKAYGALGSTNCNLKNEALPEVGSVTVFSHPDDVSVERFAAVHGPVRLLLVCNWKKLETEIGQDMTT